MNKNLVLIIIIGIIFFSTLATNATADEDNINILCTNTVLADFVSNLLTENVTVEYIMPPGICPAFYDTTPSDVNKIVTADIIISFGSPTMEPWLGDLIDYNPSGNLIECKNLGEWNYPSGAKVYIEYLETELSKLYSELNNTLQSNAEEYIDKIDAKFAELQNRINNNSYNDKKVICMAWLKDFIEYLGLNVTYSYEPPQGLSLKDELDVINAASSNDVYAVIDNLQSGTDFGARVASESGASHVIFTNFPDAIPGTKTYLDMITYNTDQLIKGIATYEYKKGELAELESQVTNLELQRNISLIFVVIFIILAFTFLIMYNKK
ncbi:MAG: zinc ABC transporter substrate-binding protein [Thermoplasmatales archaeon]|nr:MAG: zinc ABC transporter substrate-binding protein [Thermoplasmatales archaeon]